MRADRRSGRPWGWRVATVVGLVTLAGAAQAAGPSFDCSKVEAGSVEELVCRDAELSTADSKLAEVYAQALEQAGNEQPPVLKATQRGWIKGRDACWKAEDKRACVADAYRLRTAELQARYRLLPPTGAATYLCGDQPGKEVTATFFATDPPTAVAERGDQVALMYQQPAASGARYQGQNEALWEHQGEAAITWGYDTPELHCKVKR